MDAPAVYNDPEKELAFRAALAAASERNRLTDPRLVAGLVEPVEPFAEKQAEAA
jgi:hypothetical protein